MDEKETKSLGVCHRLFNFIMKILTLQALRKAALGCPAGRVSSPALLSDAIHGKGGMKSDPMAQAVGFLKSDTSKESDSSTSLGSLPQNDQAEDDKESPPTEAEEEEGGGDAVKAEEEEGGGDAVKAEEDASAQPRAPKKMVSINERVEDINKSMKKRKKSKSFDRSNSLENGEDEPKPLKSILKVGSNRDEDTEAYVNQNPS